MQPINAGNMTQPLQEIVKVPVYHFSIPGHATRPEFAIYIVVAKRRELPEVRLYVGKTGDNRDGCNPVISRAGNHFSFNDIHSQVRNKLGAPPHEFDFDYFYVTFDPYDVADSERRSKIEVVNEMERQANMLLQQQLPRDDRVMLMNPHKNARRLSAAEKHARAQIASAERMAVLRELATATLHHVVDLQRDPAVSGACG
jgi:hypothetical protein